MKVPDLRLQDTPFSRGNKGAEGTSLRLPPQVFPELSLRVGLHLGWAAPGGGDDKEAEAGDPPCTTTLQPHAPTYAAQLPVEVAPAGLLAAPIQPARPFQHNLLLRGKSDSRPPCAGRSHEQTGRCSACFPARPLFSPHPPQPWPGPRRAPRPM